MRMKTLAEDNAEEIEEVKEMIGRLIIRIENLEQGWYENGLDII